MTEATPEVHHQRHGLYYPFFHVRDEKWLKVAALYWPKIVRLVPEGYQDYGPGRGTQAHTARALNDVFLVRRPPGPSVEAVAPRFIDLISNYGDELRTYFTHGNIVPDTGSTTAVHINQIAPAVLDALVDIGLAVRQGPSSLRDVVPLERRRQWIEAADDPHNDWELNDYILPAVRHNSPEWVIMPQRLVAVYTSVLAEDFAAANRLHPTTDQDDAYAVTNNWTAESIAAALFDRSAPARSAPKGDLAEAVGFLALNLVVPANLDAVPVEKIIEIRERYGTEFIAFGEEVNRVAAGFGELSHIRDSAVLEQYLNDVVTARFAQPLEDLRGKMRQLTGDAALMSINVKTELPAAVLASGGAWLAGQPLIAETSAAAIGLMAIRRSIRRQRETVMESAPAASFLLHTRAYLQPRTLLNRALHQLAKIAGISID